MAKSVLVLGANRGLGLEFAKQYASDSYVVIATCRRPAEAAELRRVGVRIEATKLCRFGRPPAGGDHDIAVACVLFRKFQPEAAIGAEN